MADHWLVRTKENLIAGPYTGDQIKELVLTGKLGYQDEICRSNHYWIFLHERQEVKSQLGIDVPKPGKDPDEEITETETQTETILEMESSLDAMPGGDVTRVGTLLARKKPETTLPGAPAEARNLGLPSAPLAAQSEAAPVQQPAPVPPNGVTNRVSNGVTGSSSAAKESPSRQRLVILVAAGVAAALFLVRYFTR